jgi:hypothetical protein
MRPLATNDFARYAEVENARESNKALSGAAAKRDFKTGKLLDIGSSERVVEGTVYRSALFTVQVDDIVYSARGARIRRSTKVGQERCVRPRVGTTATGADRTHQH